MLEIRKSKLRNYLIFFGVVNILFVAIAVLIYLGWGDLISQYSITNLHVSNQTVKDIANAK